MRPGCASFPTLPRPGPRKARKTRPSSGTTGTGPRSTSPPLFSTEGRLFFQTRLKYYDGFAIVEFLKQILRAVTQRVMLVWDNASIHKAGPVKQFLRDNEDHIEAHFLPAYAFKCMPVEGFNAQLKVHSLKNATYRNPADLHDRVHRKARSIQRRRKLCMSFWGQSPLRVQTSPKLCGGL